MKSHHMLALCCMSVVFFYLFLRNHVQRNMQIAKKTVVSDESQTHFFEHSRQRWKNKGSKWDKTQAERQKQLYETCNSLFGYNPRNSSKLNSSGVHEIKEKIIVPKHKIMYCAISKVGCTNLKHLLAIESMGEDFSPVNITAKELVHSWTFLRRNNLNTLNYHNELEVKTILQSFSSFMFVREPFERVLSAFRDKFEDLTRIAALKYCRLYGKYIIQRYRKNPSKKSLKKGQDVKFHEFVKFVIDSVKDNFTYDRPIDRHWLPQWLSCQPCEMRYDIIGKMDTFKEDTAYIFSPRTIKTLANITSDFTQRVSNRSNTSYFEEYYSQVSNLDKKRLYLAYKFDYDLFGFKPPFDFLGEKN